MISHILTLLEGMKNLGKLIIFIEHDISAVRQVANLVIVMHAGKNIAQGPPEEILERPELLETYLA
jgi:ABC-type branched-subunit amino acid transport system ATPase component